MNTDRPIRLQTENVGVFYGAKDAVRNVNVAFRSNTVNALIGPSGCGKTTFLRAINRMHELTPNTRVTGKILLDGQDVYASDVDPVDVRRRIGMVFQPVSNHEHLRQRCGWLAARRRKEQNQTR
jgi:phosphate transport system ATP-binding protein